MRLLIALLVWFLHAVFASRGALALENLALRQQLATYVRGQKRPRLKPEERAFWVGLSTIWKDWRSPLAFVKPATVIDWHRRGFQRFWRWRSRKPGRPRIPDEHIALIRRISADQSGWGEDRIVEALARMWNPVLRGWIQYYGRFYKSALYSVFRHLNRTLARWASRKFKRLRRHRRRAEHWLGRLARREPRLFAHWELLGLLPAAG